MPRAKRRVNPFQRDQPGPATEAENIDAFVQFVWALPSEEDARENDGSTRPAKRAKPRHTDDFICIARQHLTLICGRAASLRERLAITRKNVGGSLQLNVLSNKPGTSDNGAWRLALSPRVKNRGPGFTIYPELGPGDLSDTLETALRVAEIQSTDPGYDGCIWASVDVSVRQIDHEVDLDLSVRVFWTQNTVMWGSERTWSAAQQSLRKMVLKAWYSDFYLEGSFDSLSTWSPQDFYGAACVPTTTSLGEDFTSFDIPGLGAKLYPFQYRAVRWLLQREGMQLTRIFASGKTALQPYTWPSSKPPVSFSRMADADGNVFYASPSLGAATRDTAVFDALQNFRGGILAEEMGLGKTLEVIALLLLHRRPAGPSVVFDAFLGREVLPTPATLIVAPSPLLDQWLSELKTHAPGLKVFFYPGIKKFEKLKKDINESPTDFLARQDVVITTYEVLRSEIWVASDPPNRSMRKERQHARPSSPLTQLSWWRVCIDEAQMVENWTNNAAQLARKIPRINSWAVTGTPVKDDIQKDLRGLLLFLRYEPFASDAKAWNFLTTLDKKSFHELFNLISMRHSKSLVRSEIEIPPQKRYVITMPFTAVEEQHYQSLFEDLAETCGLDARGNPAREDWDLDDPVVQRAMRVALDRLRQTVLYPAAAGRARRQPGRRAAPMRTVEEVLSAMLEQTDSTVRGFQRSLLSSKLTRGQIVACQKQVREALAIWEAVERESTKLVEECRAELRQIIQEDRGTTELSREEEEEEEEDLEEGVTSRVGEARRRLRLALEVQHRAVFFCGNGYFSLKSNPELTKPDSDEFHRLEKLEVEAYDRAKKIRKELLQESHRKAKKLMGRLANMAEQQAFAVLPETKPVDQKGIESRKISEAMEELNAALDHQANQLDGWREHVVQMLLKPLVDEESDETTGEEYDQSTKLQDEILVYHQILRTALADRQAALTGQKNTLVEHEIKVAARMAERGQGPFPEKLLELIKVREAIKPPSIEGDPLASLRGLISEMRALSTKLRHDAATGSSRAAAELAIVTSLLGSTLKHQTEQTKAAAAVEKETELFMDTLNARIEYYRQLQEVSDMVGEYEESTEPEALDKALKAAYSMEKRLQEKLNAAEAKHRYLIHLKNTETKTEQERLCIICQSNFTIGVLTVCGHQFCKECITLWFQAHHTCPVCKRSLTWSNLHNITLKPQELKVHAESHHRDHRDVDGSDKKTAAASAKKGAAIYTEFSAEKLAEIENIELDGPSFTTKVDTLIRHLLWLRQSDPGAKSIVFSQYKEFLDILAAAFRTYGIGHASFDGHRGITDFKEDPGIEVFLLHARAHASGLNLVNASHVFLCEPLLNTALELQAIARVDRIGQQHETTVWLYIVDGTVEESIYNLSVQRRLEHMDRAVGRSKGKGREGANGNASSSSTSTAPATPELLDARLDEANALEMQEAHLSKLMSRDGISGEVVNKDDLWTCLFGHLQSRSDGQGGETASPAIRRFLAAEAAESRASA
ncbi:hypothetical protein VTJ83DRAFT_3477 [Remersonia thermophila]|uniref:Uncharacterized protein n=1 Tax=Remersonia thermophila TaxID=72144 RepID=A0ABR4DE87_9PEZI